MDQSLLTWGLANATPGSLIPLAADIKAGKRPDLNTDMLKAIMGTTDADRMKECVQVIEGKWVDRDGGGLTDKDVTVQDQLRAWDDLEMVRGFGGWNGRPVLGANALPASSWKTSITPTVRIWLVNFCSRTLADGDANADLKFLALWKPILKHVTDPDDEIALRACWVCGTAVQVSPLFASSSSRCWEADPISMC